MQLKILHCRIWKTGHTKGDYNNKMCLEGFSCRLLFNFIVFNQFCVCQYFKKIPNMKFNGNCPMFFALTHADGRTN